MREKSKRDGIKQPLNCLNELNYFRGDYYAGYGYFIEGGGVMCCYKQESQAKREILLNRRFEEEKVPQFIQNCLLDLGSSTSKNVYWSNVRQLLIWFMGNGIIKKERIKDIQPEDLNKIQKIDIIRYLDDLKNSEIKLSTINTKRTQLSSFWRNMVENKYVDENVVKTIRSKEYKPAQTNRGKLIKIPLHEDIEEMIAKINRKKDEFVRVRNLIILRVLRGTGLRESELAGLNFDDIYLGDDRPYILVISKGNYQYDEEGKDIVYLTKDAVAALCEWSLYRAQLNNVIDTEAVFINKNGKRLNEENIKAIFRNYSNGKISPHMMRHEYTTVLQRESKDYTFVAEQLRHRSCSTMINHYDSGAYRSLDVLKHM